MAKYEKVATEIRRLIRDRRLKPGDLMPSERDLAKSFQVSHNTVRSATDVLCREGVIQRSHGKGTYLAQINPEREQTQPRHRLGLLYVDLAQPLHPASQQLTFAIQRVALKAGYELIVEEMRTEELLQGKVPEMIRRRSVDALLLEGRVRDHHIQFLRDHPMLYLVLGNCPLEARVPQVRSNIEGLTYAITRELLQAGRDPVWLDADPALGDIWHVDLERFRGYANAIKEFAADGSLHLCPLESNKVAKSAAMLCRSGLTNAAIIVDNWAAAMLPAALAMHSPQPEELLIVPLPNPPLCQALSEGNVITWSHHLKLDEIAEQAVGNLVPVLEGRCEQLYSVSWEMSCRFATGTSRPRMELAAQWERRDLFAVEEHAQGRSWRHLGIPTTSEDPLNPIIETAIA